MARMGKNEWWAVQTPEGGVYVHTLAHSQATAIYKFKDHHSDWPTYRKQGYKAVKIRMSVISEWGE